MADSVNHPRHYNSHPSGVELIDVAENMGFCVGNALKYVARAGLKGDPIEDLRKSEWYLMAEIDRRQDRERPENAEARARRSQIGLAAYSRYVAAEPNPQIRRVVQLLWAAEFAPPTNGDATVTAPLTTAAEIVEEMIRDLQGAS